MSTVLARHLYHSSQLIVPNIHELATFLQHRNDPKEMWPAHPLNQICFDSFLLQFLGEEDCVLVSGVFRSGSKVRWR